MTRRTSRKPIRKNSRRRTSRGLRRNSKSVKAQPGDFIQSFDLFRAPERGSTIGHVTRVEIDPAERIEYVYFLPLVEIGMDSLAARPRDFLSEMRAPQNGIRTLRGDVTSGIRVL
jgi:hypothetical protein